MNSIVQKADIADISQLNAMSVAAKMYWE